MEQVNLATVIDQVCQEKRISKDVLIETVEQAVLRAAEKVFPDRLMEAEFDTETGQIKLGVVLYVVEEEGAGFLADDDGAGGCNSRVELEIESSEPYRVVVSSISGSGAFTLRLSTDPPPPSSDPCMGM